MRQQESKKDRAWPEEATGIDKNDTLVRGNKEEVRMALFVVRIIHNFAWNRDRKGIIFYLKRSAKSSPPSKRDRASTPTTRNLD